jgi:hypothetical protein
VEWQNRPKFYLISIKGFSLNCRSGEQKRGGPNMKEFLAMLLKTNGGKMSDFCSLAMLMKTNDLKVVSRDVDDNKGSYQK